MPESDFRLRPPFSLVPPCDTEASTLAAAKAMAEYMVSTRKDKPVSPVMVLCPSPEASRMPIMSVCPFSIQSNEYQLDSMADILAIRALAGGTADHCFFLWETTDYTGTRYVTCHAYSCSTRSNEEVEKLSAERMAQPILKEKQEGDEEEPEELVFGDLPDNVKDLVRADRCTWSLVRTNRDLFHAVANVSFTLEQTGTVKPDSLITSGRLVKLPETKKEPDDYADIR